MSQSVVFMSLKTLRPRRYRSTAPTTCKGEPNMKSVRFLLPLVLMSLATVAVAQTEATKPTDKLVTTDAEKSFSLLKSLAGTWQASVTTDPPLSNMGNGTNTQVTMRVTSSGNALVHE